MENLSIALRALFLKQKGDDILNSGHLDTNIKESLITKLLLQEKPDGYTISQLVMSAQVIQEWMRGDCNCQPLQFAKDYTIFNLVLHFAVRTLGLQDGDPVCRYRCLLRWHSLTTYLGEDLFTTAFLASHDLISQRQRLFFDWEAYLDHDCKEVNAIFDRPMADLHMHLKGSSYNFDLSWICLMNHIEQMKGIFDKVNEDRKDTGWDENIYQKIRRAAAIRLWLAHVVGLIECDITTSMLESLLVEQESSLQDFLNKINQGYDYIPINHYKDEPISNIVMASERRLMYETFKRVYEGKSKITEDIATFFYAYLTYKEEFRAALLQTNDRTGFENFSRYEELKTKFIVGEKYEPLIYKAAVEGFLERGEGRMLEARIVPKDSVEGIEHALSVINDAIDPQYKYRYDIIFHFIKKRDTNYKLGSNIRHNVLREEIKKQALAIYNFRQKSKELGNLVGMVVGIDAANSEIYTRPEVYGQAFRFLRTHEIFQDETDRPNDLNITYHVGEDFLDIADGLRAVEEALLFLGMKNGDRLGHALVLGTDVRKYYQTRYNTICETKQVLVDNMAWLYHKCVRLMGNTPLSGFLRTQFHKYFFDVYNENFQHKDKLVDYLRKRKDNAQELEEFEDSLQKLDDIQDYYQSWLLRGNSPTFGVDFDEVDLDSMDPADRLWLMAGINHHPAVDDASRNTNAMDLYERYHSGNIAQNSDAVDSFYIPQDYREDYYRLLELIQEDLLKKIERKHIAIECNPTSNYKIGEIDQYDKHPIVRFFNYGLNTPYPTHNIAVSINTDDQGIFSTCLEREYSLMACALERCNRDGMINTPRAVVEWLDKVREMSIEQRFGSHGKYINTIKIE